MLPETAQRRQPVEGTLVWQDNRLSEARYDLSAREQKLVLYAVAMIEHEDEAFKRYRINVRHFAELVGLDANALYAELRQVAESIARKPLIIANHLAPGYNKPRELLTHWFAEAEFGDGFVDVTFPPSLKPYLLRVKHDFFRYHLGVVLELKGAYTIRLYQWAKRWQFRNVQRVTVAELRAVLGTVELDAAGAIISQRLPKYGDFKKWALDPAVKEINQRTDLRVTYTEEKRRGTKTVDALRVRIGVNARAKTLETLSLSPDPQMELTLEPTAPAPAPADQGAFPSPSPATMSSSASAVPELGAEPGLAAELDELLAGVATRFGLNPRQTAGVRACAAERGLAYVREKVAVVCAEPRVNAARTFLAALKGDWKAPVPTGPPVRAARPKVNSSPAGIGPEGWRDYLRQTYPSARLPITFKELPESLQQECFQTCKQANKQVFK